MKNIKRLSEADLNRIVKKVINEQSDEMDSDEMDSGRLYSMYWYEIDSEISNIERSKNELYDLRRTIEMDENLSENDKDDLLDEINNYMRRFF